MKELEREMQEPGFWDNPDVSNRQMKELKSLQGTIEQYGQLETQQKDILELIEMAYEEEDMELVNSIREELEEFKTVFENLRIATLLSEEYDRNNAILRLNAGAGGTESCDWAQMLIECIADGLNGKGFRLKYWIIWTETKRGLNPYPGR